MEMSFHQLLLESCRGKNANLKLSYLSSWIQTNQEYQQLHIDLAKLNLSPRPTHLDTTAILLTKKTEGYKAILEAKIEIAKTTLDEYQYRILSIDEEEERRTTRQGLITSILKWEKEELNANEDALKIKRKQLETLDMNSLTLLAQRMS